MRRVYADTSAFRSPYSSPNLTLTGLGAAWPPGRSYQDVSHFVAPYRTGMFQSNQLFGLGDTMPQQTIARLPPELQRYVVSGEPMGTFRRDLSAASSQVPRWAYAILMVGTGYMGYRSYKAWKKARKGGGGSAGQ